MLLRGWVQPFAHGVTAATNEHLARCISMKSNNIPFSVQGWSGFRLLEAGLTKLSRSIKDCGTPPLISRQPTQLRALSPIEFNLKNRIHMNRTSRTIQITCTVEDVQCQTMNQRIKFLLIFVVGFCLQSWLWLTPPMTYCRQTGFNFEELRWTMHSFNSPLTHERYV